MSNEFVSHISLQFMYTRTPYIRAQTVYLVRNETISYYYCMVPDFLFYLSLFYFFIIVIILFFGIDNMRTRVHQNYIVLDDPIFIPWLTCLIREDRYHTLFPRTPGICLLLAMYTRVSFCAPES